MTHRPTAEPSVAGSAGSSGSDPTADGEAFEVTAGEATSIAGVRDTRVVLPGTAIVWGDPIDVPLGDETAALVLVHVPLFADPGRHHQPDTAEYLGWLIEVIDEAERILEIGGRLVLIVKATECRHPYLDLGVQLVRPLAEAGLTAPLTYTWCTSTASPGPLSGLPDGLDLTAAEPLWPEASWRVLVTGKGQNHRAGSILSRHQLGLPHRSTIPAEVCDIARHDVWCVPPAGPSTQGALPEQLVEVILALFTFVDDLVVNPLAGTPAVARVAERMGRRARCYEPDHQVLDRLRTATALPPGGPEPR